MRTPEPRSVAVGVALSVIVGFFWWFQLVARAQEPHLATLDLRHHHYPLYRALFSRAAGGELPLWNPYQLCGLPWLGSPMGGFFYPPHVLYLILPSHTALAALGVSHLVLIAWSTALFGRRVGLDPPAAMLASILFSFGATVRTSLVSPPLLEACAWLPLGCVAVVDVVRKPGPRPIAALALVSAMSWFAGSPQQTVYLLYGWATLLPTMLIAERAPVARWLFAGTAFACGLLLGAMIAAVHLAPIAEMATQGTRGAHQLSVDAMFPFGRNVPSIPAFLYEQTLGHGRRFSVVALALIVAAPFVRRHRAVASWAIVLGSAALLLGRTTSTPLVHLYMALPALGWFRNPVHLLLLTDFCVAVAAAIVLHSIFRSPEAARGSGNSWIVVAAALVITLARARWHLLLPALLAGSVAILVARSRRAPAATAFAVVGLATAEAFTGFANTAMLPYDRSAAAEYDAARDMYDELRRLQGAGRVWVLRPRLFGTDLSPKLPSLFGVRSLDDYESVTLRRQAEYFTYLLEGRTTPADPHLVFPGMLTSGIATRDLEQLPARRRLLDLASVRVLLVPAAMTSLEPVRTLVAESQLRALPSRWPAFAMYENRHAVPRAYVVHNAEAAPDTASLLARLSAPDFDPLQTAYVEGFELARGEPPRHGQPARIIRDDPEVVEIETPPLEARGLLVLSDSFYPGWSVTVDGARTRIFPANHLFRGVVVEPGVHVVRFEYRPWSIPIGALVSLVGVLTALALLFGNLHPRLAASRS